MATTTNYGWTTPDDTALVKDGASAIRTLGSSIDTTTKALNPETTLGDFAYRSSTANVKTRLGLGTAGQVLTVNSGATAPEWQNQVGGFDPLFNLEASGQFVRTASNAALTTITAVEDVTWYVPIFLSNSTFDRIGCATGGPFSGTSTVRLGLYNASTTTGKPTTVVFDAGTVSCTENGTAYLITISQTISAGWYFLAFNSQSAAATNSFSAVNGTAGMVSGVLPNYTSLVTNNTLSFYSETGITGAFATAGALVAPSGNGPLVGLRVA